MQSIQLIKSKVLIPIGIGLLVGTAMALLDLSLFRPALPEGVYRLAIQHSTVERMALFASLAVVDELVYRLVLVSALAWLLKRICRDNFAWCAAIVIVAFIYIPLHSSYVAGLGPLTPLTLLRELVEHVGAGIVWGALFWKRGLVACIAGHASAHGPIQLGWSLV